MKGKIIFGTHRKPDRYFLDDVEVAKKQYDKAFPQVPDFSGGVAPEASADWNKPILSMGLGVVKKRIKDAEALCRQHGAPTDFSTHRGLPVLRNRAHRRQVLKIFQMRDHDGGYGD
jgi:hypothetical protein